MITTKLYEFLVEKVRMILFTVPELLDNKNDTTCEICCKVFCDIQSKKRHYKGVHQKLKKFKCSDCDHRCSQKSNLNQHHKDVHQKLKNFKCPDCDYRCSQKSSLKLHHEGVHLKIKNFKCPYCSKRSSHNSNLQKHINAIHKD